MWTVNLQHSSSIPLFFVYSVILSFEWWLFDTSLVDTCIGCSGEKLQEHSCSPGHCCRAPLFSIITQMYSPIQQHTVHFWGLAQQNLTKIPAHQATIFLVGYHLLLLLFCTKRHQCFFKANDLRLFPAYLLVILLPIYPEGKITIIMQHSLP